MKITFKIYFRINEPDQLAYIKNEIPAKCELCNNFSYSHNENISRGKLNFTP